MEKYLITKWTNKFYDKNKIKKEKYVQISNTNTNFFDEEYKKHGYQGIVFNCLNYLFVPMLKAKMANQMKKIFEIFNLMIKEELNQNDEDSILILNQFLEENLTENKVDKCSNYYSCILACICRMDYKQIVIFRELLSFSYYLFVCLIDISMEMQKVNLVDDLLEIYHYFLSTKKDCVLFYNNTKTEINLKHGYFDELYLKFEKYKTDSKIFKETKEDIINFFIIENKNEIKNINILNFINVIYNVTCFYFRIKITNYHECIKSIDLLNYKILKEQSLLFNEEYSKLEKTFNYFYVLGLIYSEAYRFYLCMPFVEFNESVFNLIMFHKVKKNKKIKLGKDLKFDLGKYIITYDIGLEFDDYNYNKHETHIDVEFGKEIILINENNSRNNQFINGYIKVFENSLVKQLLKFSKDEFVEKIIQIKNYIFETQTTICISEHQKQAMDELLINIQKDCSLEVNIFNFLNEFLFETFFNTNNHAHSHEYYYNINSQYLLKYNSVFEISEMIYQVFPFIIVFIMENLKLNLVKNLEEESFKKIFLIMCSVVSNICSNIIVSTLKKQKDEELFSKLKQIFYLSYLETYLYFSFEII